MRGNSEQAAQMHSAQRKAQTNACLSQLVTYTLALNAAQNSAVVLDAPPTTIHLEPGHSVGRCNTVCKANAPHTRQTPLLICPLLVSGFWVIVIATFLYYLYARESQINCFINRTRPGQVTY